MKGIAVFSLLQILLERTVISAEVHSSRVTTPIAIRHSGARRPAPRRKRYPFRIALKRLALDYLVSVTGCGGLNCRVDTHRCTRGKILLVTGLDYSCLVCRIMFLLDLVYFSCPLHLSYLFTFLSDCVRLVSS